MKVISLKVPDNLDEQLDEIASRRDVSRSEIVQEQFRGLLGQKGLLPTA